MKRKFFFCLSLFVGFSLSAQVNTFNKHVAFPHFPVGGVTHGLEQTTDRGYVLCRGTGDSLTDLPYYDLFKYDKAGNYKWGKRLDLGAVTTSIKPFTLSVSKTKEGGFLLATSIFNGSVNPEIVLVKTDSVGDVEWSAKYPAEGISTVSLVKQTTDLGYIVCGSTTDASNNQFAYIFKVDNLGNYSWGKKIVINGEIKGFFNSVAEIPGQGYVATGYSGGYGLIVKTDLNGNLIWDKNVLGVSLNSVIATQDSSLVFTGATYGSDYYFLILKTDQMGNTLWAKNLQPSHPSYHGSVGRQVEEKPNRDLVFCGYLSDAIPAEMLLTTNSDGEVKWCKQYRYTWMTFTDSYSDLLLTADEGLAFSMFGGTHTGPGMTNNFSTIFVKTDSLGNVGCDGESYSMNLAGVVPVITSNTLISNCGNQLSYAALLSPLLRTDTTICENILDPGSTDDVLENETSNFDMLASPNPFSNELIINYRLQSASRNVLMEIYDVNGIKKYSISKDNFNVGEYSLTISTVDFKPGIYFYSVTVDGKRAAGKIIKVN